MRSPPPPPGLVHKDLSARKMLALRTSTTFACKLNTGNIHYTYDAKDDPDHDQDLPSGRIFLVVGSS